MKILLYIFLSFAFSEENLMDMLMVGNVVGSPGDIVEIPVTLIRGDSDVLLNGLVAKFTFTYNSGLEISEELEFIESIECTKLDVPIGNNMLSLLLMDMNEQEPESQILIGNIIFLIPNNSNPGDTFLFSSLDESGSSSNYETIFFSEGIEEMVAHATCTYSIPKT